MRLLQCAFGKIDDGRRRERGAKPSKHARRRFSHLRRITGNLLDERNCALALILGREQIRKRGDRGVWFKICDQCLLKDDGRALGLAEAFERLGRLEDKISTFQVSIGAQLPASGPSERACG